MNSIHQRNKKIVLIISKEFDEGLIRENNIELILLKHKNCKVQLSKGERNLLSKVRRRVETSFSQLARN